jgi:ribosomal protein L37AE/L43A
MKGPMCPSCKITLTLTLYAAPHWRCHVCGFSGPASGLDKLQDFEGLAEIRWREEQEYKKQLAAERKLEREARERRAREARKYKCPGCQEIIVLTPEEYERGLGYTVRPRDTYSCPYCDEKGDKKGLLNRIIDWFVS